VRSFILILLFSLRLPGQAATWADVQKSRDYLDAKKHLADYLPDLAIPRIKTLLVQPDLDETAKAYLLTLLAEAQIRQALVSDTSTRSTLLAVALRTLDDRSLREFSPAHLWRSYALTNLGRFEDAIQELKRIDRKSMMEQADLEMASLMITLGNTTDARGKLEPLLQSGDAALKKKANLQLISVDLLESQLDEAEKRLADFKPEGLREEGLQRYLTGRLQLARGERLLAAGTFQELLASPNLIKALPSPLYHETTLAVADSLTLDNGEESAVTSLLQTLEKHPDSPRLAGIFARLKAWAPKIEAAPVIDKLSKWVPQPVNETPPGDPPEKEQPNPTPPTREALQPHSLYALEFLATLNFRSEDPTMRERGLAQLALLQKNISPGSPLLNRALLELSIMYLDGKEFEKSLAALKQITDGPAPPRLKAFATALSGTVSFAQDDPAKASESFLEAANMAKKVREDELRTISELNAGITLLAVTRSKELDAMTRNLESHEAKSFLVLERGLYLSAKQDPAARDLLDNFITKIPTSPRRDEAALSLAESAAFTEPIDPELAKLQITPLKFDFETQPLLEARRLLVLLSLNLGREQASDFLAKAKDHPLAPRVHFQLAQSYRLGDDKDVGSAYQEFEQFLKDYPDNEFTEAARYLGALSALSSGESAQKKAILRFRQLITKKGVLANEAALALASLLIDRDQHKTALAEINTALKKTKLSDSDRRRFLIMAADASGQLGKYEDVLTYYDRLLKIQNLPISTRNRASFQRGQALETLGRKAEALESYLSVVNRDFNPGQTSSLEWKWFDKCGLEGALALLENEKRWRAAISLAEKLGRSGSPRAKNAQEAAERIGLEQRIWRDR